VPARLRHADRDLRFQRKRGFGDFAERNRETGPTLLVRAGQIVERLLSRRRFAILIVSSAAEPEAREPGTFRRGLDRDFAFEIEVCSRRSVKITAVHRQLDRGRLANGRRLGRQVELDPVGHIVLD
jgi:hypothetical protein